MKNTYIIFIALSIILVLNSCKKEDENSCDQTIVIDGNRYDNTLTNNYTIKNAKITGNCLELEISASGCTGESWIFSLYDSEIINEALYPQRFSRLSLENSENCEALITRKVSFDLIPIQYGGGVVLIELDGWDETLNFDY